MAYKSDWTPGILPYIVALIVIVLIALGTSTLFDSYPSWVGITIFFTFLVIGLPSLCLIYLKRKRANK